MAKVLSYPLRRFAPRPPNLEGQLATTANVITHFLSLRQGEYPEGGERVDKTGKGGMGPSL